MAVLGSTVLTYADWAKRQDPDGKIAAIIELLSERNEWFDDAMTREANDGTTHLSTVRTGIPQAAWRLLNQGVPLNKSTTAQIRDGCGMLETYAEVDKALADLTGDSRGFRLSEATAFLEGMSQQITQTFLYGNTNINPERFLGLAPRFSTIQTAVADSARNVVDAGGVSTTNTSVWFVSWGERTTHMIYPKGSKAGIYHQDLGEDTLVEGALRRQIYRDHFRCDMGMVVRDWRYIVRVANIETVGVTRIDASAATLQAFIYVLMDAAERMYKQQGEGIRTVMYMNRYVRGALRKAIHSQLIGGTLTWEKVGGKEVMMFMGWPVRLIDQLLNTEARVV